LLIVVVAFVFIINSYCYFYADITSSIGLTSYFTSVSSYIDSKKEHWYPGAMVVLRDVDETNKLKVSIWLRHTLNFQDMGMRFVRRELVLQEMIRVLKDLDIEYRMLPLDVNKALLFFFNEELLQIYKNCWCEFSTIRKCFSLWIQQY
jgi:hypothetical protein